MTLTVGELRELMNGLPDEMAVGFVDAWCDFEPATAAKVEEAMSPGVRHQMQTQWTAMRRSGVPRMIRRQAQLEKFGDQRKLIIYGFPAEDPGPDI